MKNTKLKAEDFKDLRKSVTYASKITRKKFPAEEIKALCEARGIEFEDGDEKLVVELVASKDVVDRDGDIVVQSGIDLTNYLKNSISLWAHDYDGPLFGYSLKEELGDANTIFKSLILMDAQAYPIQSRQVKKGMLRGISIGFKPKKGGLKYPSDSERAALGMGPYGAIITACDLYEITFCPVGANQDALVVGVSKSLQKKEKESLARKNLNMFLDKEVEEMNAAELKSVVMEALEEVAFIGASLKSGDNLEEHHITALTKCGKALGNAQERIKSILHDHKDPGEEFTEEHQGHLAKAIRYTEKAGMHMKSVMFDNGDDGDEDDTPKEKSVEDLMENFNRERGLLPPDPIEAFNSRFAT